MSSDEDELTSPVLPKDSDPGSSVSSELQVIQVKTNVPFSTYFHTADSAALNYFCLVWFLCVFGPTTVFI